MIRAYQAEDLHTVAKIWHASGLDEYHYLPSFQALDAAAALTVFKDVILAACDIWVEERNGQLRGFMALNQSYIDRLYVHPSQQRHGVGSALINFAKSLHPAGLTLHTHQQNTQARKFYDKHGFTAIEFGLSPPPESVPDVKYAWPGSAEKQVEGK